MELSDWNSTFFFPDCLFSSLKQIFIEVQLIHNVLGSSVQWVNHLYKLCLLFLDSISIKIITEYWEEFPLLYSRSLLLIDFIYQVKVTQSCPMLCNPMDYIVHGIPGQNSGVGSHPLLQGIFPTQGSNANLPLQADSLQAEPPGKPIWYIVAGMCQSQSPNLPPPVPPW